MPSLTEPERIGERLRWAREQAGLSQGQIAQLLGCHRPTISQIESGQRTVRPDEIVKFAELYGIDETWILRGQSKSMTEDASKLALVARELKKLKPKDLEKVLNLVQVLRSKGREKA